MTQCDFNSASLYGYCITAYCIDDSTARALLGFESRTSRLSAFLANLLAAWLTCINAVHTPVNRAHCTMLFVTVHILQAHMQCTRLHYSTASRQVCCNTVLALQGKQGSQ